MSRELMFENDHAICWKTTITPNAPLKMHRHDQARCIVGLKGGVLKKTEEDGRVSNLVFETGKAYWLPKDPPNELHADVNEGEDDVVVIVTELKEEADRDGTAEFGAKREPFAGLKMPKGWEPPTTKRDE